MIHVYLSRYPFIGRLRNGQKIVIQNATEAFFVSQGKNDITYDPVGKITHLKFYDKDIKFLGAEENGDLFGVYEEQLYRFLKVEGKVVVDVGANIADSAIYFALREAKLIIAIEPEKQAIEAAAKNIALNGMENKIVLLNAVLSNESSNIRGKIDKGTGARFSSSSNGSLFQTVSIDLIVKQYNVNDGILKMDCEGCEYQSLLSMNIDTLRTFSEIMIEYHKYATSIVKKLESASFKTYFSNDTGLGTEYNPNRKCGLIYAVREEW